MVFNKGEVDLFKTICEMYDVTDVEKSVLFEAAKSAEKRMEEEMANNANEMPVSQ